MQHRWFDNMHFGLTQIKEIWTAKYACWKGTAIWTNRTELELTSVSKKGRWTMTQSNSILLMFYIKIELKCICALWKPHLSIEISQWTDIQDFLKSYVISFGSLCTVQLSKQLSKPLSTMHHQALNKPLWFPGTRRTQKIWYSIWTEPNDMRIPFLSI